MGCDIHVFTEYREVSYDYSLKKKYIMGEWTSADFYRKVLDPETNRDSYLRVPIYSNRNYDLFGRLAGVRHTQIDPIDFPRGIPKDSCDIIKEEYYNDCTFYHTPSYFSLKELEEASVKIKFNVEGMVDEQNLELISQGKSPKMYCGWTNSPNFVLANWTEYYDPLQDFVNRARIRAEDIFYYLSDVEKENFRIVFWFDN